jgi:hypothetical protein
MPTCTIVFKMLKVKSKARKIWSPCSSIKTPKTAVCRSQSFARLARFVAAQIIQLFATADVDWTPPVKRHPAQHRPVP